MSWTLKSGGAASRRLFPTFFLLAFACAAIGAGGPRQDREVEFAVGLRNLGYHDLAIEVLEKLKKDELREEKERLRIAEELAESLLAAADVAREPADQLALSARAFAEIEPLLQPKAPPLELARLRSKRGELRIARGQILTRLIGRKTAGIDLQKLTQEGYAEFQKALEDFEAAMKIYADAIKAIEKKEDVSDADRAERERLMNLQLEGENKLAWTRYRMGLLYDTAGDKEKAKTELAAAATVFEKIARTHRGLMVSVSASLGHGMCLQYLGKHADAVRAFSVVTSARLGTKPDPILAEMVQNAFFQKARSLNAQGLYEEAVNTIDLLFLKFPRLKGSFAEAARVEKAKAFGSHASSLRAQALAHLKNAEALKKETDPKKKSEANILENKAKELKPQYQRQYEKAIEIIRPIAAEGGEMSQLANTLLATWIQESELQVRRSGQEYFAEAEKFFTEKKYAQAIKSYRKAILETAPTAKTPIRLHSWVQMGKSYAFLNRYLEAGLVLGQAARLYPDSPLAENCALYSTNLLGAQYEQGKTPYEAQLYLRSQEYLVQRFPNNPASPKAAFRLGDLRRAQKDYIGAATYYSKVPEQSPFYEKAQFLGGECYWLSFLDNAAAEKPSPEKLSKLWQEAERRLLNFIEWAAKQPTGTPEQAAERDKWTAEAKIRLAEIYVHEHVGQAEKALAILAKLPAEHPKQGELIPRSYALRVRALGELDRLQEAAAALDSLLKTFPKFGQNALACRWLGSAYLKHAEKLREAKGSDTELLSANRNAGKYLIQALTLDPNQNIEEYALVGGQLYKGQMYAECVEVFKKLIERFGADPKNKQIVDESHEWMGKCYMAMDTPTSWPLAVAEFELLVKAHPKLMDLRRNLAICYEKTAQFDKAIDQWMTIEGTLRQGTAPWFEARYHLAKIYAEKRDMPTAYRILATLLISHPNLGGKEWQPKFMELVKEKFDEPHRQKFEELAKSLSEKKG